MAAEPVTLADAIGNVELLDDFQLTDSQPMLEAHCAPLEYRVNFDTNFEDRNAFITGNAKYIEEATRHGEFKEMLEEGFQHAGNLYTWRCCSRAVPMAKSNDQPNRVEINKTVVNVLIPEVDKLYRFRKFANNAIDRFCDEIKRLCHPEKRNDFVSEAYKLTLGEFMNMFAILDELKNMKASIKNDFSTFRRAAQSLQSQQDVKLPASEAIHDMHELSMFLATHNIIRDTLKNKLQSIDAYEEIMADVVNICVYLFENNMYISPAQRHMFVKVLAFSLYLIDGPVPHVAKLDQKKRISIARLDKIFKSLEVVPLYGDMQIQPFSFVKKSPNFDPSKWPLSNIESEKCHVSIVDKVKTIREHHSEYVTHISRINNEAVVYENEGPRTDSENRELSKVTLCGIQLLCAWTSDVVETISWKLLHPTNTRENHDCPETAEEYERATRYNYSSAEKAALIEVISMIKGLHKLLKRMEADFTQAIRKHIYAELQNLVRTTLCEPLQKAMKNKKDMLSCIIQSICDTCVDNRTGQYNPRSHDLISKNKKKKAEATSSMTEVRFQPRNVPPSTTQLYMVRTMLESLISDRASNGKRIQKFSKEIESKHYTSMLEFLRMSYHWPALLNFSETLENSCELSQLWFREFYLEMTMGQRIQFPIEMSMPWILTDYILTSEDPALTECILYQLDLYNDAAFYSLTKFKKQFLYDEVEAEVNLCFDQFVYKLSEAVFTYYKQLSASMLLDKQFKSECTHLGITIRTPACARFESLLKQRHIQLLGRSIDLNRLVGQRLNIAILRSLDVAISKFESESLTSIVELEKLIEANRLCHRLLKQHVGSLADFEDLFTEANHNVSAPYGRITLHAFWEINFDFIPHYMYNGSTHRFVRSKLLLRQDVNREKAPSAGFAYLWGSKSLNAAFSNIYSMYSGFIGSPHLKSLARMLGYQGIAVVVEELVKLSNHLVNGPLKGHAQRLMDLMPTVCKMPIYDYGSPAVLEYYLHHLKGVLNYPELKRDFFQVLREFGNIILFCMQLEIALGQEEIADLLCAAPFTNVIPKPEAKTTEEQELKMKKLEQKYQRIQIASMVEQIGNQGQGTIAREGELLTKERLCCGLNIFENILAKIRSMLLDNANNHIWIGTFPDNGVMCIDECNQFHRLWSAIQFAICDTLQSDQSRIAGGHGEDARHIPLPEEIFGDSIHWAGLVIVMLLSQHRRFEVLDFCYHILRVHRADGKDGMADGRKLSRFVDRVRRVQLLNNQIFSVLNNYTQTFDAMDDRVRDLEPPIHGSYHQ